ncbi:MAG: hypothetical protein ACR2OJ_08345 [Hyphomicrobiales bacterium]
MTSPNKRDEEAKKAQRHFERIREQDERILGDKHSGDEDAINDPVEIWGKRIGRGLGYLFAGYLIYHLFVTYVIK